MKWRPGGWSSPFNFLVVGDGSLEHTSTRTTPLLHKAISNYLKGKYCNEYCWFLSYEMWGIHISYPHQSSAHLLFGDGVLHFTSSNCCTDVSYSDPELFNKISELLYKWSDHD